ncbi:hypothetical protein GCM10023080_020580 [Streptomyces pseudoechinosporeus]
MTSAGGAAGLTFGYQNRGSHVTAWLDRSRNVLVTEVMTDGTSRGEQVTALPSGFQWDSWHNVTAEVRGTRMTVEVSEDRLRDAVATQHRRLPAEAARPGEIGTAARGAGTAADNVGAVKLHTPGTTRVPDPEPGTQLTDFSDEFNGNTVPGTAPDSPWKWVRGPASGTTMTGGALSWPTRNTELNLGTNTASVLTRDAPEGDYTVETKLHFTPGQANQKAGLVLYENEVRASTSRDGKHWVNSGVWTLPVKGELKIGLVSLNTAGAVAQFDYLRTYRS